MTRSLSLVAVVALTACGGAPPPVTAPSTSAPATSEPAPAPPPPNEPPRAKGRAAFRDEADVALAPPDRPLHDAARGAVRSGHLQDAKRLLGRLAFAYPDHALLAEQYNAVVARLEHQQGLAKAALEASPLRTLPPAPAAHTVESRGPSSPTMPRLTKNSEKRNAVTDEEDWFRKSGLTLPEYFVPPPQDFLFAEGVTETTVKAVLGQFVYVEHTPSPRFLTAELPTHIPFAYGTRRLTHAIASPPYDVAIYGTDVVAVFDGRGLVSGVVDLAAYTHPPASRAGVQKVGEASLSSGGTTTRGDVVVETQSITLGLTWAAVRDGVLYVTHSNPHFAKTNHGQNAYVTAIDLAAGKMLWRSDPLVANAHTFALVEGALVTGYGFTNEPDFVFVLDRATGAVTQKLPVRSGPEYIVPKSDQLFVRTYDTDYVFAVR